MITPLLSQLAIEKTILVSPTYAVKCHYITSKLRRSTDSVNAHAGPFFPIYFAARSYIELSRMI